ncbi:MAG TPA: hypothetical protein VH796_08160 [Nitrososphaeraceae archaeon]|jgi:hypothetical protein
MKTSLQSSEKCAVLVVSFLVSIVILAPQLLAENTHAQLPSTNGTKLDNSTAPKMNATNSITVPVSNGYVNGKIGFFIATDASDAHIAASIANSTGFNVNYSPSLASSPESSLQQGYDFINGVNQDDSPMGFQLGVSTASPGQKGYSPLYALNFVKWNSDATPRILKSASEILKAEKNGELTISKTGIVINSPEVVLNK